MEAQRTLKDYATNKEFHSSIVHPAVDANNFEIKLSILLMVQRVQFSSSSTNDLNLDLFIFDVLCDTLKIDGVGNKVIRLTLFPFFLRDRAKSWLEFIPYNSLMKCNELKVASLAQYFSPSKIIHLRNRITCFRKDSGKSLYKVWERFKEI